MQEKVIRAIEGGEELRLALETWFKGHDEDYFRIVSRENQATAFKVKPPSEGEEDSQAVDNGDSEDEDQIEDEVESGAQKSDPQDSTEEVCQGHEALRIMIQSAGALSGGSIFVEDTDVVLSVGSLATGFKQGLAVGSFEFVAPASVTVSASGHTRITAYAVFHRHPDSMAETSFLVNYRMKGASNSSLFSEVEFEQKKIFAYVLSSIEFNVDGEGDKELELLIGEDVLHVHSFAAAASSHVSEATLSDIMERYQSAETNGE
jgi:hypothetical protein